MWSEPGSHRLVTALRKQTLDVVEAVSSWQRRSAVPRQFIYRGEDYFRTLGGDLEFLEGCTFVVTRVKHIEGYRITEDPFLKYLTADCIPVDEADGGGGGVA